MDTKIYVFSLDYGKRSEEKEFIKAILREFDKDTVVGCGIFVNNNPYCLELLLYVSMKKEKTGSWGAGLLCIYTVR